MATAFSAIAALVIVLLALGLLHLQVVLAVFLASTSVLLTLNNEMHQPTVGIQ